VTIKQGRVDEVGSPEELANSKGIYAQLLAITNQNDEKAKKQLKAFEIAN
jgi:ATP-binding cassette subfamily B protein